MERQRNAPKVLTIIRVYRLVSSRIHGHEGDAEEEVEFEVGNFLEEELGGDDVGEEEEAVGDDQSGVDVDEEEVVDDEDQHEDPGGHLEGVEVEVVEGGDDEEDGLAALVAVGAGAVGGDAGVVVAPPGFHEEDGEVQDDHRHVAEHLPPLGVDQVAVDRLEEPGGFVVVDLVHFVGVVLEELEVLDVDGTAGRGLVVEAGVDHFAFRSHFIAVKYK